MFVDAQERGRGKLKRRDGLLGLLVLSNPLHTPDASYMVHRIEHAW